MGRLDVWTAVSYERNLGLMHESNRVDNVSNFSLCLGCMQIRIIPIARYYQGQCEDRWTEPIYEEVVQSKE